MPGVSPLGSPPHPRGRAADVRLAVRAQRDKYARLVALDRAGPARDSTRRAELRDLSARHPGSLRERERLGPAALAARLAVVDDLAARLGDPAADAALLDAPPYAFLRAVLALEARLADALAARRLLAAGEPPAVAATHLGLPEPFVAAVAAPPEGHLTRVALAAAAADLALPVADLVQTLYHPAAPPAEETAA